MSVVWQRDLLLFSCCYCCRRRQNKETVQPKEGKGKAEERMLVVIGVDYYYCSLTVSRLLPLN